MKTATTFLGGVVAVPSKAVQVQNGVESLCVAISSLAYLMRYQAS